MAAAKQWYRENDERLSCRRSVLRDEGKGDRAI
jgi:hypothetical protein